MKIAIYVESLLVMVGCKIYVILCPQRSKNVCSIKFHMESNVIIGLGNLQYFVELPATNMKAEHTE